MKSLFLTLIFLVVLLACKNTTPSAALKFSQQEITEEYKQDSLVTFAAKIDYVVAEGGNTILCTAINDSIQKSISFTLQSLTEESTIENFDIKAAVKKFRTSFDAFVGEQKKLFPKEQMHLSYDFEADAKVSGQNEKVVCITIGEYYYTGGAHPNTNIATFVFDKQSGKCIPLSALVKDKNAFQQIIEESFRAERKIDSKLSLESEGFYMDENTKKLRLPVTYSLSEDGKGIVFSYASYEVASYAAGPTDFTIPLTSLDKALDLSQLR